MFNSRIFENSRSDGHGVLQVVTPATDPGTRDSDIQAPDTMLPDDSYARFVALKETHLSGRVSGPLASLTLRQTFGYTRAQSEAVLEAVYRFPLSGDAAVTGVRVRFGDVEIVTQLKEREEAEAEYAAAKDAGQQATLLSRESPDVFTLQVAGIRPDEDVTVETSYVTLARADGLRWVIRVPLTTAPRFVRQDELGSAYARGQPLALLRDPGHRFSLKIVLEGADSGGAGNEGAGAIESPTHDLVFEQEGDNQIVQLAAGSVIPDRDCVLMWQAVQTPDATSMTVYGHDDVEDGHFYFLAMITPPSKIADDATLPREVLLLVDHSGSMTGPKWAAADWAVERFLSDLKPDDSFALATFHTEVNWHRRSLVAADPETIDQAVQWLKANRDSGGTNLGVALEQALNIKSLPGPRARNVLIVTDAQVSDMGRLLRLVDQEASKSDGRRINILCIDAAPNSYLVNQMVEHGGGVAKFLTSSPEEIDITTALDEILTIWGEPVLVNLRLTVNRVGIEPAGNRLVDLDGQPVIDAGDLVSGQSRWIAGRTSRGDGDPLVITLRSATGDPVAFAQLDLSDLPAVKALFGARRINGLEHLVQSGYRHDELGAQLLSIGYDPQAISLPLEEGVYAETQREVQEAALRDLMVAESLAYQLPSSVASFVAVRTEAGQRIDGTVAVANGLPAGWSETFSANFSPRSRALSMPGNRMSGILPGGPGVNLSAQAAPVASSMPHPAMAPGAAMGIGPMGGPGPKEWTVLVDGPVAIENGRALLYDSTLDASQPPAPTTITGLRVQLGQDVADRSQIDQSIEILLYVEDPALPRARVRLADLLRHGERPLNLACGENQLVRIELRDPAGVLADGVEVVLEIRW